MKPLTPTPKPTEQELIHIKVTNNLPSQKIFIIRLKDTSGFAQEASKTIMIDPFKTTNVFLPLNINKNAEPGKYTAITEVTDGISVLASDTITVSIPEIQEITESTQSPAFISVIPTFAWFIINIALLALLFMALRVVKHKF